jgi:serine protease Do
MLRGIARAAGFALLLSCLPGPEARAQSGRRTPVVEAVRKTRDAVVAVRAEKPGEYSRKEVLGTGVVVDERGYVVTNRHVVAGADRVTVRLAGGVELAAKVEAEDGRHDLAVLKVAAGRTLAALPLGPSGDLMVGETVIAVGHPLGYSHTVSTGIVSGLGRDVMLPGGEVLTGLIQTDAAINPGNSGGPLLNVDGEVVGIVVAVRDGARGIAFALDADVVQRVLSERLSSGRVARVAHGLGCREQVGPEGCARQRVVVERLADAGPAAEAGLRPGDVLAKLAGLPVANRFDVERALWECKPGDRVPAAVVRDGRETNVVLRLGKAGGPAPADAAEAPPRARGGGRAEPVRDRR